MGFNSNTLPRKLNYPLNRASAIQCDTEGAGNTALFSWPTTDNDEKVTITLELSLNEYIALASSIDVGSDIAYAEDALKIWWIWIRANTMAFCDNVNDCLINNAGTQTALNTVIENNTTIQQTINNTLINSGQINPNTSNPDIPEVNDRFPPSSRQEDVKDPPPGCDKDALWTGILECVTRIDAMGRDFYEQVVANVDKVERITSIIDLVPLFGDTIADGVQVFADIVPDLLNAYNAHSTQQEIEDTACALFEIVCQDCRYPTFDEFYEHYANLGITGIQDISSYGVQAALDYLIGTDGLANAVVWYTTQAIGLYIMYMGGNWLNYRGTKWLQIWADIGEDAPNNGWELLCDGCADEWCFSMDLTPWTNWDFSSSPGFQIAGVLNGSEWDASVCVGGVGYVLAIGIESQVFTEFQLTKIQVDYDAVKGTTSQSTYPTRIRLKRAGVTQWDSASHQANPNWGMNLTFEYNSYLIEQQTVDQVWFAGVYNNSGSATPDGLGKLKAIRLYGTGTNPFGSNNC